MYKCFAAWQIGLEEEKGKETIQGEKLFCLIIYVV
jgi:hypothetical protein